MIILRVSTSKKWLNSDIAHSYTSYSTEPFSWNEKVSAVGGIKHVKYKDSEYDWLYNANFILFIDILVETELNYK